MDTKTKHQLFLTDGYYVSLSSKFIYKFSAIQSSPKPESVWKENIIIFKFLENNRFQNVDQSYKTDYSTCNTILRISTFVFYYLTLYK